MYISYLKHLHCIQRALTIVVGTQFETQERDLVYVLHGGIVTGINRARDWLGHGEEIRPEVAGPLLVVAVPHPALGQRLLPLILPKVSLGLPRLPHRVVAELVDIPMALMPRIDVGSDVGADPSQVVVQVRPVAAVRLGVVDAAHHVCRRGHRHSAAVTHGHSAGHDHPGGRASVARVAAGARPRTPRVGGVIVLVLVAPGGEEDGAELGGCRSTDPEMNKR